MCESVCVCGGYVGGWYVTKSIAMCVKINLQIFAPLCDYVLINDKGQALQKTSMGQVEIQTK